MSQGLVLLNVLVDRVNLVFVVVAFLAELVHVVPQGIVLLLCLDEGGNDLVDVGDAGSLLDDSEGLLDNLGVAAVLGKEAGLLLILVEHILQTDFHDLNWVIELLVSAVGL